MSYKLRLSTSIEEILPFLGKIYDEGDDDYLNDILTYYKVAPEKYPVNVYVTETESKINGIACLKYYNNTTWVMWWNLPEEITIGSFLSRLDWYAGTDGVYWAHVEKYDINKIKHLEMSNFSFVDNVGNFRKDNNIPKNFFYYDKDYVMKGVF